MNRHISLIIGLIVLCISGFLIYESWNKDDDVKLAGKTTIRLQLQWFDQAQFIGFYVADSKGYYAEEGLTIKIVPGGFNINPIMKVRMGDADIGLATADQVLLQKAAGHDIRAFGNVFNKSIACFISRQDLNIQAPHDLLGKKVGVYKGFDTENILLSILKKHNIDEKNINIIDAGSFAAFLANELDAFPSYLINEPMLAKEKGIPVNILYPDDFGVQFYSDTIFTTEEYLKNNRASLARFLKASERGWDYAEQNPEEAIDILYRHTRSSGSKLSSSSHQKRMLQKVLEHIRGGPQNRMFFMDRTRWDSMERSLFSIDKLKTQGHVGELCDFTLANQRE